MSCFTEGYVEFPSLDGCLESKCWNMSLSHNLHIYIYVYVVSLSLSLSLYKHIYIYTAAGGSGSSQLRRQVPTHRVLEAPATLRPASPLQRMVAMRLVDPNMSSPARCCTGGAFPKAISRQYFAGVYH